MDADLHPSKNSSRNLRLSSNSVENNQKIKWQKMGWQDLWPHNDRVVKDSSAKRLNLASSIPTVSRSHSASSLLAASRGTGQPPELASAAVRTAYRVPMMYHAAIVATMDWLYPLSGFVVGALVGLTGMGGGSLMTPLLILLFGVHPLTAVGTDLLYAAATKTAGTAIHSKKGNVD